MFDDWHLGRGLCLRCCERYEEDLTAPLCQPCYGDCMDEIYQVQCTQAEANGGEWEEITTYPMLGYKVTTLVRRRGG